jgi:hypothetical protein
VDEKETLQSELDTALAQALARVKELEAVCDAHEETERELCVVNRAAENALASARELLERLRDTPPARRNAWLQALRSEVTTWLVSHPAPVAEDSDD